MSERPGHEHCEVVIASLESQLANAQQRAEAAEQKAANLTIERDKIEDRLNVGLENTARERDTLRADLGRAELRIKELEKELATK